MKEKLTFCLIAALMLCSASTYAKAGTEGKKFPVNSSIIRELVKDPVKEWLPVIKLNTRAAFHSFLSGGDEQKTNFKFDYLRLEVDGRLTDRISYKWCQHLNKSNRGAGMDHMPSSIDCLGLNFQLTPTLSTFVGKQYSDFGGFEYDANPAEEYSFSDFGSHITCFLVGVDLKWKFCPSQEIRFQVVNGHSDYSKSTYGEMPEGISEAKAPLGYTCNWNGSFFDSRLTTRSSVSVFHEAEKENMFMTAVGLQWKSERFRMYTDVWYSTEDIDKLGLLSQTINPTGTSAARNSENFSVLTRIDLRLGSRFNVFTKGSYETTSVRKAYDNMQAGKYRTSYSYSGGIEYFPMHENLRIFAMYHGQNVEFTDKGAALGNLDLDPQRFSFGVVYRIPVL